MKREKRLKIEKEKKEKILTKGGVAVALSSPRSGEQENLFGDKDQIYNTIQAEISIIVVEIGSCHDSIEKQKEKIVIRQRRKDNLEKAARSVAKMRDEELKKKKEEKLKK